MRHLIVLVHLFQLLHGGLIEHDVADERKVGRRRTFIVNLLSGIVLCHLQGICSYTLVVLIPCLVVGILRLDGQQGLLILLLFQQSLLMQFIKVLQSQVLHSFVSLVEILSAHLLQLLLVVLLTL